MAINKPKCKDGTNGHTIPNVYEVQALWHTSQGTAVVNTFHYSITDLPSNPIAWGDWLQSWWDTVGNAYCNLMWSGMTLQALSLADMDVPRQHHIEYVPGGSLTGQIDGTPSDWQSAVQVTWVTFASFTGGHAGFRIGPLIGVDISNSIVDSGYRDLVHTLATAILGFTNLPGPSSELVAPRTCDGTLFNITSFVINQVVASQNTRQPGRGI